MPEVVEPWEGGRSTVDGFMLVAVVVLLARVCVGTRLEGCGFCPSDEVGLAPTPGLVVDVEGG